jgi:leader peptidase (prepilin peptidase)/N-methyltransferase
VSLVPVISWVAQRGRCRHCQGRISPAYPLVEIAALLLAVWTMSVMTAAAGWMLAASCVLGWTLLALALIDVRHFILPDALTLPLAAAGLMVTLAVDPGRFTSHLAASLAGFAAFALIGILYRRIRGRDGLGLGDAKLLAAGGAWVGFEGLAGILLVASFTALGWALVQGAIRRELSSRTRIAFGPFLAFGIWIVWLYGPVEFGYMTWTI